MKGLEPIRLEDLPDEGEFMTEDGMRITVGTEHLIGPHTFTCCMVSKDGHTRVCTRNQLQDAIDVVEDECLKDIFNKIKE